MKPAGILLNSICAILALTSIYLFLFYNPEDLSDRARILIPAAVSLSVALICAIIGTGFMIIAAIENKRTKEREPSEIGNEAINRILSPSERVQFQMEALEDLSDDEKTAVERYNSHKRS